MCSYQHFSFIFIVHTSVEWNSLNNNSIKYCMACVSVGTQNNSAENMIRFNTIWQDKLSVACWTFLFVVYFVAVFPAGQKKGHNLITPPTSNICTYFQSRANVSMCGHTVCWFCLTMLVHVHWLRQRFNHWCCCLFFGSRAVRFLASLFHFISTINLHENERFCDSISDTV